MWEAAAAAVAKAVLGHVTRAGAERLVRDRADRTAFERAVRDSLIATEADHRERVRRFDLRADFLALEGATELAKLLLPGRGPDARNLADAYIRSLGGRRSAKVGPFVGELEAVFEALLDHLVTELGRRDNFRIRLAEVAATRLVARAGLADEREFLAWVAETFAYVQTAGIGTAEHVQVPLTDVFVTLQARRETTPGVRWRTGEEEQRALLEERLRSGQLSNEEYEAILDRHALGEQSPRNVGESVEVTALTRDNDRVLVLGDPGSGKTTLLRYLALRHAQGLLDPQAVDPALGRPRLPLYTRAGNFARSAERKHGLQRFIPHYLSATLECPVERLDDFVSARLRSGDCLVLLDGLDEVTTAADRHEVVSSIASFVRAYQPRGNRFVCTSRIAGYAAAPLPTEFAAVRLLEMDDASIERFLGLYVPAIERIEAPNKSDEMVRRDSARTIDQLVDAFRRVPGVRRLAANPLLLVALLLVHRTRGQLPERRVDAYKAVTDALGRTWRALQGVPAAELPDERRLTQWLTRLADWLHRSRPEGSATVRDLLTVLGPLWARLRRQDWDDSVLADADIEATDAGREILEFVRQVEAHSGLLVERAPRRWGFPHLTFEEFYAGRALAFEGRASARAARIRERLHDPRYTEPILLALGLVGSEQPEESESLLEAAILARGEEAEALGLTPSALEEIVPRDFLFALRALADDIPASPELVDTLLRRALDEWFNLSGAGAFTSYRNALGERLGDLSTVTAGRELRKLLLARFKDVSSDHEKGRLVALARYLLPDQSVGEFVAALALSSADQEVAIDVASALLDAGGLTEPVKGRLLELATSEDARVAVAAATVLGRAGALGESLQARLVELLADETSGVVFEAAQALEDAGRIAQSVEAELVELLASENPAVSLAVSFALTGPRALWESTQLQLVELVASPDIRASNYAARVLEAHELPEVVQPRLVEMATGDDTRVAVTAAKTLARAGQLGAPLLDRLIQLVASDDARVAIGAAEVLGSATGLADSVQARLLELVASDDAEIQGEAAEALAAAGELEESARARLVELLGSADSRAAIGAARALRYADGGAMAEPVQARLVEIVASDDQGIAEEAATLLDGVPILTDITPEAAARAAALAAADVGWRARAGAFAIVGNAVPSAELVDALLLRIQNDSDNDVRRAAVLALVEFARTDPTWDEEIKRRLVGATTDIAYATQDRVAHRTGHDYAYDGLWLLHERGSEA